MLKQNHYRALQALLTTPTRLEAAKVAGIQIKTLERYFEDQEFVDEYRRRQTQMVDEATQQMRATLNPAVSTLLKIAQDEETSKPTRVQACSRLLEYTAKYIEVSDILKQLAPLTGDDD